MKNLSQNILFSITIVLLLTIILNLLLFKKTSSTYSSYEPLNFILPYAVGTNADIEIKDLIPYVEKELGIPITIINKPGNDGWNAWTQLFDGNDDDNTIGYIDTPTFLTGYLNPRYKNRKVSFRELNLIATHIFNSYAIAVRADDKRFNNFQDLIEYSREQNVSIISPKKGDAGHLASLKFNQKYITNFISVHTSGRILGAETLLKGYTDVIFDNAGILSRAEKEGKIKILAVVSSKRSKFLPNTPTVDELGYDAIHAWASSGIVAPIGMNPQKIKLLKSAFEKAINNKEHLKKMNSLGYEIKFLKDNEYYQFLEEEEESIRKIINIIYFLS